MKASLSGLSSIVAVTAFILPLSALAAPSVVYNAMPSPLPPNMASLGFQATQTSEFGDYVHLGGSERVLKTVTVTMSDWALYSDYASDVRYMSNSASWSHPISLNIYSVVPGSPNTKGPLLATVTQTITIPWRPVADPTCAGGTAWRSPSDSLCYNGLAFNATFDLSSLSVTLPNDVIVGVAYNTQSYGTTPIGVNGPYNSLNVGVVGSAVIGTDDNVDNVFWNTITAGWYTDGGAGGVGIFREDTAWSPYGTLPVTITATSPLVGPPTNKDQCKNDGWKTFNNPSFKNQGACVSFVEKQKDK